MCCTASFTAPPEFTVLSERTGRTGPDLLTKETDGPHKLPPASRSWLVTYINWRRRRRFVDPVDEGARARWSGFGAPCARSFTLTRAVRDVSLGEDPRVPLSGRRRRRSRGQGEIPGRCIRPAPSSPAF